MLSWLKNSILALALLSAPLAMAQSLYTASVPAESRSQAHTTQAMQTALQQVAVKVSGQQDVSSNADLDPALREVNNLVSRYSFDKDEDGNLLLTVTFDREAVNLALMQAKLPVWDGFRPVNIVWAVVDINGSRYMLTQGEAQAEVLAARDELQRQAAQRGMKLIFPLGDLADRQTVTSSDIWGGFQQRINQASQRYDSDGILVLKLRKLTNGSYQIDWNASLGREKARGHRSNIVLAEALQEPVDSMADISANVYAIAFEQIDETTLVVTDLKEVQDYAQVYAYLKQLNTVNDVQLVEFAADNVVFNIKLTSRLATFERNLSLDGLLLPSAKTDDPIESNTVVYRYMP